MRDNASGYLYAVEEAEAAWHGTETGRTRMLLAVQLNIEQFGRFSTKYSRKELEKLLFALVFLPKHGYSVSRHFKRKGLRGSCPISPLENSVFQSLCDLPAVPEANNLFLSPSTNSGKNTHCLLFSGQCV